jgi:heteromeric Ino2p/Ino4p transcription factor
MSVSMDSNMDRTETSIGSKGSANSGDESSGNRTRSGLTSEQKKLNHIESENRRRAMIRSSFDRLVELVPDLDESESRSELAILDKTSKYIEELRAENDRLEQLRKRSVE